MYTLEAKVWKYEGKAAWYFLTLSKEISADIRVHKPSKGAGWGQVPVEVQIGKTTWRTSLFPNKHKTFDLPIKKSVREAESLSERSQVSAQIRLV